MFVSPGMVLLTVGCEPLMGAAWMRKPVMVSALDRQVSVKEVSFRSAMRTRRGGVTSASRGKANGHRTTELLTSAAGISSFNNAAAYFPVFSSRPLAVCW